MRKTNVTVFRQREESTEELINRFLKRVSKHGVIGEVLKRQYFISKKEQRRLKQRGKR